MNGPEYAAYRFYSGIEPGLVKYILQVEAGAYPVVKKFLCAYNDIRE